MQRSPYGTQQCQACNGSHQLFGERREYAGNGCAKEADQHIHCPARHGCGVAARGLGVRLRPHTNGSGNRTEAKRKGTKRSQ